MTLYWVKTLETEIANNRCHEKLLTRNHAGQGVGTSGRYSK